MEVLIRPSGIWIRNIKRTVSLNNNNTLKKRNLDKTNVRTKYNIKIQIINSISENFVSFFFFLLIKFFFGASPVIGMCVTRWRIQSKI